MPINKSNTKLDENYRKKKRPMNLDLSGLILFFLQ